MLLAAAHAFASYYPLIMIIQLHLNLLMVMVVACQASIGRAW